MKEKASVFALFMLIVSILWVVAFFLAPQGWKPIRPTEIHHGDRTITLPIEPPDGKWYRMKYDDGAEECWLAKNDRWKQVEVKTCDVMGGKP